MSRSTAVTFTLVFVLALLLPASSHASTSGTTTYYLHGVTPVANVEETTDSNTGATPGPTMDATAPTLPVSKTALPSAFGNENFYKNFLLAYWAGQAHGAITGASADLWVASASGTTLSASLLADGSPARLSTVTVHVPAGGPANVHIAFPGTAMVDKEFILQVASYDDTAGAVNAIVLFDSTTTPSSFSFSLGAYVPPSSGGGSNPAWTAAAGWGPVNVVSTTLAARETSLVVDPTNNANMWLCTPSGVPNTQYDQSYFYKTTDNGASWDYTRVETSQTDARNYTFEGGDCDVAYDAGGAMYTADTWLGDLSVGHSTDGGDTWAGTPLAVTSPVVDRPWLVGGPAGTIHVSYQDVQFGMPTAIWYTRSTDGGNTFLPAVPVATSTADGAWSWEGNFVVSPDQKDLYLVYTKRVDPEYLTGDSETVWVAASHDGGLTWASTKVASTPHSASYLYPSIAMDAAGYLHVVYASSTSSDQPIWYSFSKDGASWSAPVPIARGVSGFAPWIAGGAAGDAAIEWLGTPATVNATSQDQDWFFYGARVTGADTTSPVISSGTTTTTPIFHGTQSATPEFNQVRLDANGKMRLGMSVFYGSGTSVGWAELYQAEN